MAHVTFEYLTGPRQTIFESARLSGSWNGQGRRSDNWTTAAMTPFVTADGCPAYRATVTLDDAEVNQTFDWGVRVDTPSNPSVQMFGVSQLRSTTRSGLNRHRTLRLRPDPQTGQQTERYYLTYCRRFGANKLIIAGQADPAIRFAVWAPNATDVALVRGNIASGYIRNNGAGITETIPMHREEDGVWEDAWRMRLPWRISAAPSITPPTCTGSPRTTTGERSPTGPISIPESNRIG